MSALAWSVAGALAWKLLATSDRVAAISVEGRSYWVVALGGGRYEVRSQDVPGVSLLLGQEGPIARTGDAAQLSVLEADMRRFPRDVLR